MRLVEQWALVREGARIGAQQVGQAFGGHKPERYKGSAEEICRQVVAACWNGTYFRAGIDHLDQFWIRDFAICLDGLLDLGYAEQARACLEWALEIYARAGRVTTTIFAHKDPVDIYTYSCDSLPFLLYCLERLEMGQARERYRDLITRETSLYYVKIFDSAAGQARGGRMFSGIQDTMRFTGTCYTNTMVAWCADLLARCPELPNPFRPFDLRAKVSELFWTGEFFKNDLHTKPPLCSANANFWPYWCAVAEGSERKLPKSIAAVRAHKMDEPFPLKHHEKRLPEYEIAVQRFFIPNYQGDAIWTFFTPQWIELVGTVEPDLARRYTALYCGWIEKYGTWIEVFEPDGSRPLRGRLGGRSDWGMLWAASWPKVVRKFGKPAEEKGQ